MADPKAEIRQYDPALAEIAREGGEDDEVSLIARVPDLAALPAGVRVVTKFGEVVTLRASRAQIAALADCPAVLEMEASHHVMPSDGRDEPEDDPEILPDDDSTVLESSPYLRRPDGLTATGSGVVLGALDWGIDFALEAFRNQDGSTRLLGLWDQRGDEGAGRDNRWNYGRILTADDINAALAAPDPYAALGYHPADADGPDPISRIRSGAHGTHVLDIAGGSDRGDGMSGVAPDADLVFVHLARTTDVLGRGNLGDSASLLEALDYVFAIAGDRPCVVNLSVGAHGGPHDGSTLVEQGIDRAVWLQSGRAVISSIGNYAASAAHRHGRLREGDEVALDVRIPADDPTANELEIWYAWTDRFTAAVFDPDGAALARLGSGDEAALVVDGRTVGHAYHVRAAGNGDHQLDLFLKPHAPGGVWTVRLRGERVQDGRWNAWIERERGPRPRFLSPMGDVRYSTGTLCNGRFSIGVGAYDPHRPSRRLARFSSAGPTRDGRMKPDLVAPGVRIAAARSTPRGEAPASGIAVKSGTSMAAPHVAGTVAVMFEAHARPLDILDTRALLLGSADRPAMDDEAADPYQVGSGCLNPVAAEAAARLWVQDDSVEDAMSALRHTDDSDESGRSAADSAAPAEALVAGGAAGSETLLVEPAWSRGTEEITPEDQPPEEIAAHPAFRELLLEMADAAPVHDSDDLRVLALSARGHDAEGPLVAIADPSGMQDLPRPGDLLVRSAPAQGVHYSAVVLSEQAETPWTLAARGIPVEQAGIGFYVEVAEVPADGGAVRTVGRRLADAWGRLPPGQAVFRPVDEGASASDALREQDDVTATPFAVIGGFAFDRVDMGPSQQAQIEGLARHLLAGAIRSVRLVGHTDPVGSASYNLNLGRRRAEAVRQALAAALEHLRPGSARSVTVTVESVGEARPLSTSRAPEQRARDRRVEVFLPASPQPAPPEPDTIERICRRGLELVQQLEHFGTRITGHQQQRIRCFISRVCQASFDDRYLTAQGVLDYTNGLYADPYYASAKQWLLPAYAVRAGGMRPDDVIWRTLIRIDDDIIQGRGKINYFFATHGAATPVRVQRLRDWVAGQENNDRSIYWCYGRNAP